LREEVIEPSYLMRAEETFVLQNTSSIPIKSLVCAMCTSACLSGRKQVRVRARARARVDRGRRGRRDDNGLLINSRSNRPSLHIKSKSFEACQ